MIVTHSELEYYGLPVTFDEDMGHDFESIGEEERFRALAIISDPKKMDWEVVEHHHCWDIGWPSRIWFWLKAGLSLMLNYRVSLWARECVTIAVWDITSCHYEYSGDDWTELVVRPGFRLGFDIYRNSSY